MEQVWCLVEDKEVVAEVPPEELKVLWRFDQTMTHKMGELKRAR